jgi:hypothetical protein
VISPGEAQEILRDCNERNRPITPVSLQKLKYELATHKWELNGDAVRFSKSGVLMDGQNRLKACVEMGIAIITVVVVGLSEKAMATIDQLRRPRTPATYLGFRGVQQNKTEIALALVCLVRWQRLDFKSFVDNEDIIAAYEANPSISSAVALCKGLFRSLASVPALTCVYYRLNQENSELATDFVNGLTDPSDLSADHPLYLLREAFDKRREELQRPNSKAKHYRADEVVAMAIKTANAMHSGERPKQIKWRTTGAKPEPMPDLNVKPIAAAAE